MTEGPENMSSKLQLDPTLLLPSSPSDFTAWRCSYWSCSAGALAPAAVMQPRTAQDVSAALRTLVASATPFAVRSGGHMAWAGSNNISGPGVVLDLARMAWARLVPGNDDDDDVVAELGPGGRWGDVYTSLAREGGQLVAGGREGNVGVAGLVLGGGLAFFTPRHGLACDNVVEFEVVLADGSVVRARENNAHADLWRALRGGGGCNFGIVTNITMRTLPDRPVWGGMMTFDMANEQAAARALVDFVAAVEDAPDANLLVFFTHEPGAENVVIAAAVIETAGVENAPAYRNLLDLPCLSSTCAITTIPELAAAYGQPRGYRSIWFTATFRAAESIVRRSAALHADLVAALKEQMTDGDFASYVLFQPLPRLFGRLGKGRNVLGLDRLKHDGLLWLASVQVRTAEQEARARPLVGGMTAALKAFAAAEVPDGDLGWTYLNYADGSQDPLASYGEENVRFLQNVARRYDPDRVFQTLCPGGFKLSTVLPG